MNFDEVIDQVQKVLGLQQLDENLLHLIRVSFDYLNNPTETNKKAAIAAMTPKESNGLKFALGDDEVQIMIGSENRISQIRIHIDKTDLDDDENKISCGVIKDLVERPLVTDQTPQVKTVLAYLHSENKPMIAFFGGVRKSKPKQSADLANKTLKELLGDPDVTAENKTESPNKGTFGFIGVLTAGYRGAKDQSYGTLRAFYDGCKLYHKKTISCVIMPEIGENDRHQNPGAMDTMGKTWGDDTPALIAMSDAIIVLAPYGLITELEIASAIKHQRPVVIINPLQQNNKEEIKTADCGYQYNPSVLSFKNYKDAVSELNEMLPPGKFNKNDLKPASLFKMSLTNKQKEQGSFINYHFSGAGWTNISNDEFTEQINKQSGSVILESHTLNAKDVEKSKSRLDQSKSVSNTSNSNNNNNNSSPRLSGKKRGPQ